MEKRTKDSPKRPFGKNSDQIIEILRMIATAPAETEGIPLIKSRTRNKGDGDCDDEGDDDLPFLARHTHKAKTRGPSNKKNKKRVAILAGGWMKHNHVHHFDAEGIRMCSWFTSHLFISFVRWCTSS